MPIGTPEGDAPVTKTIQVTEPVPEQFADLGFLDSWRLMARRTAFDAMLKEIGSEEVFTAKFNMREVWEPKANGKGRHLSIVCEIQYQIDTPKNS